MRVVTIGAVDDAFIHPMLKRHGKLRPDPGMALIAELSLRLRQQKLRRRRTMNGMAIGTNHVGLRMGRAPDVGAWEILGVAIQASIENLAGIELFERPDGGRAAARGNVSISRAVAAFAASLFGRLIGQRDTAVVGVLIENVGDFVVAGGANARSNILGLRTRGRCWRARGCLAPSNGGEEKGTSAC